MNLNSNEKKELVKAYNEKNEEVVARLVAKARGGCTTCSGWKYNKTWVDYWLNNGELTQQ